MFVRCTRSEPQASRLARAARRGERVDPGACRIATGRRTSPIASAPKDAGCCRPIESMSGARFVHDQLELAGWDVRIADAARMKGLAPLACKTGSDGALSVLRLQSPRFAGLTLTELNPDHTETGAGSLEQLARDLARGFARGPADAREAAGGSAFPDLNPPDKSADLQYGGAT